MGRVAYWVGSWIGTDGQVKPDDGTDPRRSHDVEPRLSALLDTAQLARGQAGGSRDEGLGHASRSSGGADLVAEIGEQAPAAASATGCVGLRHRQILIVPAHQPINCTATIGP